VPRQSHFFNSFGFFFSCPFHKENMKQSQHKCSLSIIPWRYVFYSTGPSAVAALTVSSIKETAVASVHSGMVAHPYVEMSSVVSRLPSRLSAYTKNIYTCSLIVFSDLRCIVSSIFRNSLFFRFYSWDALVLPFFGAIRFEANLKPRARTLDLSPPPAGNTHTPIRSYDRISFGGHDSL